MALSFLILISAPSCAFAAQLLESQSTVRAEPAVPTADQGTRTNLYQIELDHKGVLKGDLADMASSSEQADDVVTLSGQPRSVHDGLQVLRIHDEHEAKQGSGCAVVGLGLILASLVGIAMKLNEAQDPYSDLRGGSKPLNWVKMVVHSSNEAFEDGVPAMLKENAQEAAQAAGDMMSLALRKVGAQIRRMARPGGMANLAKGDFGLGRQNCAPGVQFTTMLSEDDSTDDLLGEPRFLVPDEPLPSELAGMTMEALAKQLEAAGQDELAAKMLSTNSKSLAMGQLSSEVKEVHLLDIDDESDFLG